MESKVAKLQEATEQSLQDVTNAKSEYDDSLFRLKSAKELLQAMDKEDQEKMMINDTKLPELLELHSIAKQRYEEAKVRYETNDRYLTMLLDKLNKS
jgi:hypothetical protein